MKKSLSNLENKYYYGISRTFWHLFAFIAVIGCFVGIIIIGWSFIPASKDEVVKPPIPKRAEYPPQAKVKLNEILNSLPQDKNEIEQIKNTTKENINVPQQVENNSERDTIGLSNFKNQISSLKNLLPISDFTKLWNGEGYYTYPKGKAIYRIKKLESLRKFVRTSPGLVNEIISITDKNGFNGYNEKTEILKSIINIFTDLNINQREDLIYTLLNYNNGDIHKTVKSLNTLYKLIKQFDSDDKVKAYEKYRYTLKRNSNEGNDLLNYQSKIIEKFDVNERYDASKIITSEYENRYNNNLDGLIENTQFFVTMLKDISPTKQAIALDSYYKIYKSKNKNRIAEIERINIKHRNKVENIENQYKNNLAKVNRDYIHSKKSKSTWRWNSLKVIGAGLGIILLVTVILLLLSMIRNINKLAQEIINSNKYTNPENS